MGDRGLPTVISRPIARDPPKRDIARAMGAGRRMLTSVRPLDRAHARPAATPPEETCSSVTTHPGLRVK